jgi:hypothetical protein
VQIALLRHRHRQVLRGIARGQAAVELVAGAGVAGGRSKPRSTVPVDTRTHRVEFDSASHPNRNAANALIATAAGATMPAKAVVDRPRHEIVSFWDRSP